MKLFCQHLCNTEPRQQTQATYLYFLHLSRNPYLDKLTVQSVLRDLIPITAAPRYLCRTGTQLFDATLPDWAIYCDI